MFWISRSNKLYLDFPETIGWSIDVSICIAVLLLFFPWSLITISLLTSTRLDLAWLAHVDHNQYKIVASHCIASIDRSHCWVRKTKLPFSGNENENVSFTLAYLHFIWISWFSFAFLRYSAQLHFKLKPTAFVRLLVLCFCFFLFWDNIYRVSTWA